MSFRKFEYVKQRNPKLSALLDALAAYVRKQTESGQPYILPKLAAAYLGLTDGEAFVLLELLARENLLERIYNVYCRNESNFLATITNPDSLNEVPFCDACGLEHDPSDLRVALAFRPLKGDPMFVAA